MAIRLLELLKIYVNSLPLRLRCIRHKTRCWISVLPIPHPLYLHRSHGFRDPAHINHLWISACNNISTYYSSPCYLLYTFEFTWWHQSYFEVLNGSSQTNLRMNRDFFFPYPGINLLLYQLILAYFLVTATEHPLEALTVLCCTKQSNKNDECHGT